MAELTRQLREVNTGKPIIEPGRPAPSALGTIASTLADAVPGVVGLGAERDRRRAEADRQAAERAQDEAAQAIFDVRAQATRDALNVRTAEAATTAETAIRAAPPADVATAITGLVRSLRGVDQGRISQGSYDLQLERSMADLFQKYPEQRAEIATYFQASGIDHFMFRAFRADADLYKGEQEAQLAAAQHQYGVAAQAGLITRDTPLDEGALEGRRFLEKQALIAEAKARADELRANTELDLRIREAELRETAGQVEGALMGQAAQAITPLLENALLAVSAAGDDATRQAQLGERQVQTLAALSAWESRGVAELGAAGATKEEIDAFKAQAAAARESINSIFTTSFEVNVRSMRNMEAAFGITSMRAAPMYHRVVQLIGQPAANALFGDIEGLQQLAPEVVDSVKREMRNFDPTTERGTASLARMIGYLRGDLGLKDLTGEEALPYLRSNSRAIKANEAAILRGNTSALRPWMANLANTTEAVLELPPTATTAASLLNATTQFATPESRRALAIAIRDDSEYGLALAQASRGAAANVLNIGLRAPPDEGPYTLAYNANRRLGAGFEPVLTREAYNQWAARQAGPTRRLGAGLAGAMSGGWARNETVIPSYEEMQRNVPENVRQRQTALNNALNHLVETDQYDDAIPSSLTPRERRAMYATGRTPDSMRTRDSEQPASAETEFNRLVSTWDTNIQKLMTDTVSRPLPNTNRDRVMNYEARDVGFNEVPAEVRTLGQFSDFARQVNRAGADSSAAGIYQITGQTLRGRNEQNGYAEKVFGDNWREVEWNAENQDKIAEAIFNDHRHSAQALRGQWVSLSIEEAERVRKLPWAQARRIIAQGESG